MLKMMVYEWDIVYECWKRLKAVRKVDRIGMKVQILYTHEERGCGISLRIAWSVRLSLECQGVTV